MFDRLLEKVNGFQKNVVVTEDVTFSRRIQPGSKITIKNKDGSYYRKGVTAHLVEAKTLFDGKFGLAIEISGSKEPKQQKWVCESKYDFEPEGDEDVTPDVKDNLDDGPVDGGDEDVTPDAEDNMDDVPVDGGDEAMDDSPADDEMEPTLADLFSEFEEHASIPQVAALKAYIRATLDSGASVEEAEEPSVDEELPPLEDEKPTAEDEELPPVEDKEPAVEDEEELEEGKVPVSTEDETSTIKKLIESKDQLKVGDKVQLIDEKNKAVIAQVFKIDEALGVDGELHAVIETTGHKTEDKQEWFALDEYKVYRLAAKKAVKESAKTKAAK